VQIKTITMDCPDCNEQLSCRIGCINSDPTVFDVAEVENMDFYCSDCDKTYYVGEINVFSEDEI
jgi:uncharacterized protein with PIN domain